MTPHDLKHTAACLAVSASAKVKALQRMLGHRSAAMTLNTYADLFTSRAVGIIQPAVSKDYKTLRQEGLLPDDGARQLSLSQLTSLIDYTIDSYPGPGASPPIEMSSIGAWLVISEC